MAIPTLRALLHLYRDRLTVVCGTEPFALELLESLGATRCIPTPFSNVRGPDQPADATLLSCWNVDVDVLAPQIQGTDALFCLCFQAGPAFAELTRCLGGVPTIGFQTQDVARSLAVVLPPGMDAWQRCWDAVLTIDPTQPFNNHAWRPRHAMAAQIRAALREQVGEGPLLVVHADTKTDKMWPLAHWKELLARLLAEEPPLQIVMVGYPVIGFELYGEHERLIDCRNLSLMASFEVVAMADWFIGIDSCMLHVADLARVPSVGLFTAEFPACEFGFRFSPSQTLQGSNPPDDICVDSVEQAFEALRARAGEPSSAGVSNIKEWRRRRPSTATFLEEM